MSTTGTLSVVTPDGVSRYDWNGNIEDRKRAREAFNDAMGSGYFLAVIQEGPGKARQAKSFEDVEQVEKEKGTVEVQISTALVGG